LTPSSEAILRSHLSEAILRKDSTRNDYRSPLVYGWGGSQQATEKLPIFRFTLIFTPQAIEIKREYHVVVTPLRCSNWAGRGNAHNLRWQSSW
jgi:hypothetical protein